MLARRLDKRIWDVGQVCWAWEGSWLEPGFSLGYDVKEISRAHASRDAILNTFRHMLIKLLYMKTLKLYIFSLLKLQI